MASRHVRSKSEGVRIRPLGVSLWLSLSLSYKRPFVRLLSSPHHPTRSSLVVFPHLTSCSTPRRDWTIHTNHFEHLTNPFTMAPRKGNEPASWEVDAKSPKPDGETRVRRSYCVKDLITGKRPKTNGAHPGGGVLTISSHRLWLCALQDLRRVSRRFMTFSSMQLGPTSHEKRSPNVPFSR